MRAPMASLFMSSLELLQILESWHQVLNKKHKSRSIFFFLSCPQGPQQGPGRATKSQAGLGSPVSTNGYCGADGPLG